MAAPYNAQNIPAAQLDNMIRNAFNLDGATRVIIVPEAGGATFTLKARVDGPGND